MSQREVKAPVMGSFRYGNIFEKLKELNRKNDRVSLKEVIYYGSTPSHCIKMYAHPNHRCANNNLQHL